MGLPSLHRSCDSLVGTTVLGLVQPRGISDTMRCRLTMGALVVDGSLLWQGRRGRALGRGGLRIGRPGHRERVVAGTEAFRRARAPITARQRGMALHPAQLLAVAHNQLACPMGATTSG